MLAYEPTTASEEFSCELLSCGFPGCWRAPWRWRRIRTPDDRPSWRVAPGATAPTGNGGELGPNIVSRVPLRTDQELADVVRDGLPAAGMPAFAGMPTSEATDLIRFLRTLRPREGSGPSRAKLALVTGGTLDGLVLNESSADLQLLGDDRQIHLLRKEGARYRAVTSQVEWPSYDGATNGSRYSTLKQIDKANVSRMVPRWIFSLPNTSSLQVTPVVVDGVMYVTSANECYALDAGSGRADLALPARANQGAHRQLRRRRQPGRGGRGRPRVHGHRSRASHRAQPLHRRARLGDRDGRLAPELLRDGGAARRGQPGDLGHFRRRRRRARISGGVRPIHRQGGLALLDRPATGRAGVGNLAGEGRSIIPAPRPG